MNRQDVAQIVSEIPQGLDADEFLIELAKRAFVFRLKPNTERVMCKKCGKTTSHVSKLCEPHRKHWMEGYKYAVYRSLK